MFTCEFGSLGLEAESLHTGERDLLSFDTSVTALVPTIAITGNSVSPASGAATDASTQDYTVTVTVASARPSLTIGDPYGGGIVAYIDGTGVHGLIAAAADQTSDPGIQWATEPYWDISVPGALGTAIGTGAANTDAIIAQNGAGTSYAAGLARAYTSGGYSDWFLPSRDELNQLYLNRVAIGGFSTAESSCYWSSSQYAAYAPGAWLHSYHGPQSVTERAAANRVRAVRAF